MTVATFQTAIDGVNPFVVEGPSTLGSGVIVPQYRLGHVAYGDASSEYVYCKYTSVSNLVLSPGLLFQIDDDYTATILTTSAAKRGSPVMVCCVGLGQNNPQTFTTVTGSIYYLWLARSGQIPVAYTTVGTVGDLAETTATAGAANFPDSATASSKLITGLYITKAVGGTFTADLTNTSTVGINVVGLSMDGGPSWLGSTVAGTGIPGSTTISSYTAVGNTVKTITLSAAATATNAAVTVTNSLVAQARVLWPYIDKTN